jgi:pimeloyl-ACP methyl ester carboxylesterase
MVARYAECVPRVDADGVELFYESLGEGTPFVLQAHDHSPWLVFQAPYFAQFYRVITFDRRGTGRSASPPGAWSMADFARDLRALLDALGIDRAIIGGSSLGGIVAAQFGVDYPERALALIVGHTVPYLWELGREWIRDLMQDARPSLGPQPRSFEWESVGPPTTNPVFAASPMGQLVASLGTGLGRTREDVLAMHEAMLGWDQRPRYPELERLGLPSLILVGANEPQKTLELAYEWHQHLRGSEFVVLRDSYHAAPRENALVWNQTVHAFLKRHDLGGCTQLSSH